MDDGADPFPVKSMSSASTSPVAAAYAIESVSSRATGKINDAASWRFRTRVGYCNVDIVGREQIVRDRSSFACNNEMNGIVCLKFKLEQMIYFIFHVTAASQ